MSAANEVGDEDGALRPVGVSKEGLEGYARILEYVSQRAFSSEGKLNPDAVSVLSLRKFEGRDQALQDLVSAICPSGINPELWLRWFAGGEAPYTAAKIKRPEFSEVSSGRAMERLGGRMESARKRLAVAEAKAEQERENIARMEAMEKAILQWTVSEHLAQIVGPVFAMGPAWTLMRAVSAYISQGALDIHTELVTDPKKKAHLEQSVRRDREASSRRILAALDLWAGDDAFEMDLHQAIDDVVKRYEGREAERVAVKESSRGRDTMVRSARPSATTDHRAVLAGMEVADAAE